MDLSLPAIRNLDADIFKNKIIKFFFKVVVQYRYSLLEASSLTVGASSVYQGYYLQGISVIVIGIALAVLCMYKTGRYLEKNNIEDLRRGTDLSLINNYLVRIIYILTVQARMSVIMAVGIFWGIVQSTLVQGLFVVLGFSILEYLGIILIRKELKAQEAKKEIKE